MSSDNKTTSSFNFSFAFTAVIDGILVTDTPPYVALQHMTDLHIDTNSSFEPRHVVSNNVTF